VYGEMLYPRGTAAPFAIYLHWEATSVRWAGGDTNSEWEPGREAGQVGPIGCSWHCHRNYGMACRQPDSSDDRQFRPAHGASGRCPLSVRDGRIHLPEHPAWFGDSRLSRVPGCRPTLRAGRRMGRPRQLRMRGVCRGRRGGWQF